MTTKFKKIFTLFQLVAVTTMYVLPQSVGAQTVIAKAVDDNMQIEVGETINFNVLDNDDPTPGKIFQSAGSPNDSSLGNLSSDGTGNFTFTALRAGTYTFNYVMYCNTANGPSTDQATVRIVIEEGADPGPTTIDAIDDTYQTQMNTRVALSVLDNDQGANITRTSNTAPSHGRVTLDNDGTGFYTPNPGYVGVDTFQYTISNGTLTDTATVTINIKGDNSPTPGTCSIDLSANPSTIRAAQTTELTYPVSGDTNDTTVDLYVRNNSNESEFTFLRSVSRAQARTDVQLNTVGTYTFRSDITCADGSVASDTTNVVVTNTQNPNPNPTCRVNAIDDAYTTNVGSSLQFNVLTNDSTGAIFASAGSPNDSTLGSLKADGQGNFTFQANKAGTYTFNYTITCRGSNGATDQATVTIEIKGGTTNPGPGSCTPDAVNDNYGARVGTPLSFNVLSNDGRGAIFVSAGSPNDSSLGSLKADGQGNFTFSPAKTGTYTFNYTVGCRNSTKTDQATVTIVISKLDTPGPGQCVLEAKDDSYVTRVNSSLSFDVTDNDGRGVIFNSAGSPNDSSLGSLKADGQGNFTFQAKKAGTYTFNYTVVCPGNTRSVKATVTIEIKGDNNPGPRSCTIDLSATPLTTTPGSSLVLSWVTRGDAETPVRIGSKEDGRAVFNFESNQLSGNRQGTAAAVGQYEYIAAVKCADGTIARDTVTVTVRTNGGGSCPAVSANDDSYRISRNQMASFDVLSNDSTIGGVSDSLLNLDSIVDGPDNGTARIVNNRLQYTPRNNFTGTDTITYRAENDCGNGDTAVVTIQIGSNGGGGNGGGGGGGGILKPRDNDRDNVRGDDEVNLDIFNERLTRISDSKYLVTWNTNIPASSQVVYGMRSVSNPTGTCGSSDLGYQQRTDLKSNRVTTHAMVVDGLTPGAQYFFRPVSDRSDTDCAKGRELTHRPVNMCEGYIKDFMKIGQYNDPREVAKLQAFLRIYEGASSVRLTGVFDVATDQAVKDFQLKYYEEVLQPWGYARDEATGYVYITTRNKINEIICERDIPFTAAQLSEMASFRSYWNNRFQTPVSTYTPAATQPFTPDYEKSAGPEALLPAQDDSEVVASTNSGDDEVIIIGGTTDSNDSENSISDDQFFLDNVTDQATETSAEAELAEKSFAAAAIAGVGSFIFSVPFLLTILVVLILMLIYEVIKDRRNKKNAVDEVVIMQNGTPVAPVK